MGSVGDVPERYSFGEVWYMGIDSDKRSGKGSGDEGVLSMNTRSSYSLKIGNLLTKKKI